MTEAEKLIDLLKQRQALTAMLAPSFPIMYTPAVIGKLKRLGFSHVMEVTAGAKRTNDAVIAALKANPKARFITSPCPSFVRMIRTKYPEVVPYLALSVDSPMIASARIVKEQFPGERPIFIGPCNAKRFEANEDYPDLGIVAITYNELEQVFKTFNLGDDPSDQEAKFDIEYPHTRLYPISGGLAQSSEVKQILADDEVEVVSGWTNDALAIKRFMENQRVRLLDILFCDGGCIMGPGITSPLQIEARRAKVMQYWFNNRP